MPGALTRLPWWIYLAPFVLVGALVLGPRLAVLALGGGYYSVPSAAMEPTLPRGSVFLALPVAGADDIERGAVVVHDHPGKPGVVWVKRVVALPGEEFAMAGGVPVIEGAPVARMAMPGQVERVDIGQMRPDCTPIEDTGQAECPVAHWRERLPGGHVHEVLDLGQTPQDDIPPFVVPDGHVIALGDNRDNSVDSRFPEIGPIPIASVRHRAWRFFIGMPVKADHFRRILRRVE